MNFIGSSNQNTSVIWVGYWPTVDRQEMNRTTEPAKKYVGVIAEIHGWSDWLKIKEEIQMLK